MTITGGSALPKEEIDRMMREAEQFAAEDAKRREEAEARNQAESLVWTTEKFLAESGDKVDASAKADVEAKLSTLKSVMGGADLNAIRSATEDLAKASQELGSSVYSGADQSSAPGAGPTPHAGSDDDVVDAEVVDDHDHKDGK